MEWVQFQVVSGSSLLVLIVLFFLAIWTGMAAGRRNKVVGWLAGSGVLISAIGVLSPVMEALDNKACDLNCNKHQFETRPSQPYRRGEVFHRAGVIHDQFDLPEQGGEGLLCRYPGANNAMDGPQIGRARRRNRLFAETQSRV